ncbi:hypothetical protein RZN22_06075 [Bacillaceae bacterium S4-13-58]
MSMEYYVKNEGKDSICFGVKEGKLQWHISNEMMKRIPCSLDSFLMKPGKVYVDEEDSFYQCTDIPSLAKKFLYLGCTLVIILLPTTSLRHLKAQLPKFRESLKHLPIDYMIAPHLSCSHLTPEMVRYAGYHKLPFISITKPINNRYPVWDWIKQAQGYYSTPIVPHYDPLDTSLIHDMKKQGIYTLDTPLQQLPLTKDSLKKTGISPKKGELYNNKDADFNLFLEEDVNGKNLSDSSDYHSAIPSVTVLRGKVIRAGTELLDIPGFGEYYTGTSPNLFRSS